MRNEKNLTLSEVKEFLDGDEAPKGLDRFEQSRLNLAKAMKEGLKTPLKFEQQSFLDGLAIKELGSNEKEIC